MIINNLSPFIRGDKNRLLIRKNLKIERKKPTNPLRYSKERFWGYESDDKRYGNRQVPVSLSASKSTKSLKPTVNSNSLALLQITENAQNLRPMHELEAIKKFKYKAEVGLEKANPERVCTSGRFEKEKGLTGSQSK